jgi:hypothetical protein
MLFAWANNEEKQAEIMRIEKNNIEMIDDFFENVASSTGVIFLIDQVSLESSNPQNQEHEAKTQLRGWLQKFRCTCNTILLSARVPLPQFLRDTKEKGAPPNVPGS